MTTFYDAKHDLTPRRLSVRRWPQPLSPDVSERDTWNETKTIETPEGIKYATANYAADA